MHSSLGSTLQEQEFLEHVSAMLLFATYVYEEKQETSVKNVIETFFEKMQKYHHTHWIESNTADFEQMPAQGYDHPTPSSISLAEFALFRAAVILNKEYAEHKSEHKYKSALAHDFFNVLVFFQQYGHIIHTPEKIMWKKLPLHCIQLPGKIIQDCSSRTCREFASTQKLIESFKK